MRVARRVILTGRVQGVAFRWTAREQAESLGLSGWIRNRSDGAVEAWVEAEESDPALERMLAWLAQGPPAARVERCEVFDVPATSAQGFEVRRTP